MTLGNRIKSAREDAELTQGHIANELGISRNAISQWESGKTSPSLQRLTDLSTILKCSVNRLTGQIDDVGTIKGNVVSLTHKNGQPVKIRKIPVVSSTTGGNWAEVVDNFNPGDAERWIDAPDTVSDKSFALVIVGESMQPTIPDGATIIIDPEAHYKHKSVVVIRQNGNSEATCKRLIYDGSVPYLQADNKLYGRPQLMDDAVIVGVVKQVVIDL